MLEVYVLHGGRLYTLMTHLASGFSSSRIELSLATPAKRQNWQELASNDDLGISPKPPPKPPILELLIPLMMI